MRENESSARPIAQRYVYVPLSLATSTNCCRSLKLSRRNANGLEPNLASIKQSIDPHGKMSWKERAEHFVACAGSEVCGSLSLYPDPDGNYDLGMLVSPDRRGEGIGTALLREAFAWAQSHGVPKIVLGVFPHNTAAMSLYKKTGFITVRHLTLPKARQNGEIWDVIVMEKYIRQLEAAAVRQSGSR